MGSASKILIILRLKSGVCALPHQSSRLYLGSVGALANGDGLTFWLAWGTQSSALESAFRHRLSNHLTGVAGRRQPGRSNAHASAESPLLRATAPADR
ncbi:hypothetical protein D3C72_2057420 [compost metagenome]